MTNTIDAPPREDGKSLPARHRVAQFDLLRGLIMLVMAIDHVAFFVARRHPSEQWDTLLPVYPGFVAFFTRAVTHLSAPGFFLLMGVGMALFGESRRALGWSHVRIVRYFVTRGFLLLLINQVIENPAWVIGILSADPAAMWPPVDQSMVEAMSNVRIGTGVLTALGLSMVIAGLLSAIPTLSLLLSGLFAVVVSQALAPGLTEAGTEFSLLFRFLNAPGVTGVVSVLYPVLPWLGVTLCGMALGRHASKSPDSLRTLGLALGAALMVLFLVVRVNGGFGNHRVAPDGGVIGFFNVVKYPPSIAFLTLTLGINFMLLATLPALPIRGRKILDTYGRSPLFFYLAHIWLFAFVGLLFRQGTGYGTLYIVWALGMIPLYWACARYTTFKRSRPPESFWRML